MASTTVQRALFTGALTASLTLALTGCTTPAPGELGDNQQILATCTDGVRQNTVVQVDASGSGRSAEIDAERLKIIEELVRETAVCGGTVSVSAYSAASAATVPIFSGDLTMPGATDNARLRRVPAAVEKVMAKISSRWQEALDSVPGGGSDITGMWRLAAEQQAQAGDGYQLRYVNLTDGVDTLSATDLASLGTTDAANVADQLALPNLAGADVTIAGIGRVAGSPLPSSEVASLVAFYEQACRNTGARDCLAVTDWRGSR